MFANTLTLFLALSPLAADLVVGEAVSYVTTSPNEAQEFSSSTKSPGATWTTSIIPRSSGEPTGLPIDSLIFYAEETSTAAPALKGRVNVAINVQQRICNNEADFNPHPPIHSDKQKKGADYFCNNYAGIMESGMRSLRVEWHDEFGGRHHFKVSWAEGCIANGGTQHIRYPNGLQNTNPTCNDLMKDNYLQCNNGGVGGKVQAGCLIYAYNGGIVAGRDYEAIGLW
ncbi:hypothetical protein CORC01_05673 [Colletotrichum orchidophilum]|uniref:Ecp2 effector protein domain-containing protein n=1 Tax=Colletotrichum orchidophilum TaxID=1209926 RepID=A0A1G4BC62_9PEZI|nr:uncharacterized protein CORC01_05673 [Colletotrichum orchidophilum]OHE98983.1 hypothetical protein CORC01_05673 [Colletotrichum orchidophilum]